jgi:hypothetical protein
MVKKIGQVYLSLMLFSFCWFFDFLKRLLVELLKVYKNNWLNNNSLSEEVHKLSIFLLLSDFYTSTPLF